MTPPPPPPAPRQTRRWPWVLGVVVALGVGFGVGFAVQPEPEPEIVTETVEVEVEVTPESCEFALDAAHAVFDAFRDLWTQAGPVLDASSYNARDIEDLNAALDVFGESMDTLTPQWQEYASECDPRYDY